jgi:hypothetical protein
MPTVDAVLDANRRAVDDLIATGERCGSKWSAPRAPGKWPPSQIIEHVALSLEGAAKVVSAASTKSPAVPPFIRPLLRIFVFKRILKNGTFPKAKFKAAKATDPASGPATPAAARARLDGALAAFDRSCLARAASGQPVRSSFVRRGFSARLRTLRGTAHAASLQADIGRAALI